MITEDPEAKVKEAQIPREDLLKVIAEGERALADRNQWEQKLRAWYSRRYGLRSPKTFPWEGASNLNIPLTDKIMRRLKPTFQSAIFRVNPIVSIEPLGSMQDVTARNLESGYDWVVRYKMRRAREAMGFIQDAMLGYGMSVAKCTWLHQSEVKTKTIKVDWLEEEQERSDFETVDVEIEMIRRLGLNVRDHEEEIKDATRQFFANKAEISVKSEVVTYSAPRWFYIDPIDFIVPWDSDTEIDDFPWCIHRVYVSKSDLEKAVASGKYKLPTGKSVDDLHGTGNESVGTDSSSEVEQRKQLREGIKGSGTRKENSSEMWECYFRYDLDGDGVSEKYVMTVHRKSGEILRVIPYSYEHGEWPFTRFAMEANEPRWYASRGVPELIYDLQVEINAQHNAKIDNMAIQNSKAFIYKAGSVRNPANWKFYPGAMFPTKRGPEDVREVTHQPMDWSFNSEEENLRAWAEEYIGTPDFGISNINQRVERRTATEIDQIQQSTGAVAEEQLERFQESMRRLHRQTLFLWAQFGDDQVEVRTFGQAFTTPFSRFDIYRDFDLVPSGRIDNLSPQARIAKGYQLLQLAERPVSAPYIKGFEAVRDIVEGIDFRASSRFLNPPGVAETDEAMAQVNEVNVMRVIGEIHPVDQNDPHEAHVQVLQQAMQTNADDPGLVQLMEAHFAMHLYFLGEKGPLEQMIQAGAQVQQLGTKLLMELPPPQEQPQQQAPGAPQAEAPVKEAVQQ